MSPITIQKTLNVTKERSDMLRDLQKDEIDSIR